jgi:hypothetical protein
MDELAARQATAVNLGPPPFIPTASRAIAATAVLPARPHT